MTTNNQDAIETLLAGAAEARAELFDERHEGAFRLFSGFYEGLPDVVIDIYGRTAVVHNYADSPESATSTVELCFEFLRARYPWLRSGVVKPRNAATAEERRGRLAFGDAPDRKVREHGVSYAFDPFINRDASFYLDTRALREWAAATLAGKSALNTFAYTGSLGVAALAGGAARVVQTDGSREFLNVAKTSYTLNGFPIAKRDFVTGDFFAVASRLKREGALFDAVFLDAPFFSMGDGGTVDLLAESERLINKVRPLVGDGGVLVAVNNALFLSGAEYMRALEAVCGDGYLTVEGTVPVPEDSTGYPGTRVGASPIDPAPFNHSTKIALLRVRRKDGRKA